MRDKVSTYMILFGSVAALGVLFLVFLVLQPSPGSSTTTVRESPLQETSEQLVIAEENRETIVISVQDLPVLRNYLDGQEDRLTEIERMHYVILDSSRLEKYVLIQYGCGNKQCSTLLVKIYGSNLSSISLADGIYQDYRISPDQSKALLRYGYHESAEVIRHTVIVLNLDSMESIPFHTDAATNEYRDTPTWPIEDMDWIDDDKFTLEIADIDLSTFEALQEWNSTVDRKTKKLEISLRAME